MRGTNIDYVTRLTIVEMKLMRAVSQVMKMIATDVTEVNANARNAGRAAAVVAAVDTPAVALVTVTDLAATARVIALYPVAGASSTSIGMCPLLALST